MNKYLVVSDNELGRLLGLLQRLEAAKIHFRLARNLEDAVTIEVAVPGERWEIDCYANGRIDVEIFKSDGTLRDASALEDLFRAFSD